ncbi:MAG: N-acetylmuramoyl-L-alanine amidase [Vicinamibacteria bacterium]
MRFEAHRAIRRAVALGAVLIAPLAQAAAEPLVLLQEGQRREVLPLSRAGAELLPLDLLLGGARVAIRSDARGGSVTLQYEGREAIFYLRKSLASLAGDLRLLSSPVLYEDGKWLVPLDAVPRVLGPLLGVPAEWRAGSRLLLLGNVPAAKVSVDTFVAGDLVRVVLESNERVPFHVVQEAERVTVALQRDLVEVAFQQQRLTGGIVDLVQYLGGRENLLAVTLGRRFGQLTASEQERPSRLVLEFKATALATRPLPPSAPPRPAGQGPGPRTVVIDPGHGGAEVGAQGPTGVLEKDVTLAIARKLRALVTSSLGFQAFLTRDRDGEVELDERAAIANNYKADLFISIHANSSRAARASGSEVYFLSYQASDEDSRRVALAEGAVETAPAGTGNDVALILWDMAQAEHLEESSSLASRLQEELSVVTGSEGRGVKQAPFRVLVGAAMPAALVEIAFISHPEEEKLLSSDAFQSKVAAALARGIARFAREQDQREEALGRPAAGR